MRSNPPFGPDSASATRPDAKRPSPTPANAHPKDDLGKHMLRFKDWALI